MQGKSFFKYTLDATSAGRTFLMSMNDRSTEKHQKIDALYKRVLNSLKKPIGIYFVPKENGYRTYKMDDPDNICPKSTLSVAKKKSLMYVLY